MLINGAPIAASVAPGRPEANAIPTEVVEDRPEGITRDRWDVAIDTDSDTILVPCGAIRERISQELARGIFEAVKAVVESADPRTDPN